ncbi:hypothetical protein FOL47_000407 [Perkinsus chesapeaki]|uniref:Uncharacterized protein n=1 Tax=Perkinsus chesapeaki TaxID=330153 RepID=A0A7J6KVT0_PERCH|nr:hypothetical protein FOL47_000407 [Perkinsus chesapeaki]
MVKGLLASSFLQVAFGHFSTAFHDARSESRYDGDRVFRSVKWERSSECPSQGDVGYMICTPETNPCPPAPDRVKSTPVYVESLARCLLDCKGFLFPKSCPSGSRCVEYKIPDTKGFVCMYAVQDGQINPVKSVMRNQEVKKGVRIQQN